MPPSLEKFRRTNVPESKWLAWIVQHLSVEVDAKTDPLAVPIAALRRMDTDPIVYLGEHAITGLVRKPDLYHVKHPLGRRDVVAETEEWLWPLLPHLLPMIARAFIYGAIPMVLDWTQEDLTIRVPSSTTGELRNKTLPKHIHYVKASELFPSEARVEADEANELVALHYLRLDRRYDPGRARVAVWDRQFGEWWGQAARRRAWGPFAKGRIFELFQARYLERTVHAPLVIYAPSEDLPESEGGEEVTVGDFVAEKYAELVSGGSMSLPSERWDNGTGEKMFELMPLELPERSEVFDRALNRWDSQKLAAYLVPPAMPMLEEGIGGGASRVLKDLFSLFVEGFVGFAAGELQALVDRVHAQNHDPRKVPPPEVGANEIPDKVQKLYLETLRLVGDAARLGERVDVDGLLDHLGVPRRPDSPDEGGTAEGKKPAGRPRDMAGEREERREDARTEEGEDDTGGDDVDRQEQGE